MPISSYRQFCREQQRRLPVFAQDWYLDSACDGGRWDAAVVEQGDKIEAALPYFIKQKGGFRYITMPPFVKMMGPYLADPSASLTEQHRLLEALIAQLPSVAAFKQCFHYSADNWLPFYWAGYRQTTRYSYQLSLEAGADAVLQGLNRNMRRNLQKAASQLVLSHELPLEDFYRINAMSFERQGLRLPYSFPQLLRHDEALSQHQCRRIFAAFDQQGRLHAAAYLIWDAHSAWYHLSGDDPALRQSGAGIWLIWEAIRYAAEQLRLPVFDFEGSMMRNIEAIRRQFGATQHPYSAVWKYHSIPYLMIDRLRGREGM